MLITCAFLTGHSCDDSGSLLSGPCTLSCFSLFSPVTSAILSLLHIFTFVVFPHLLLSLVALLWHSISHISGVFCYLSSIASSSSSLLPPLPSLHPSTLFTYLISISSTFVFGSKNLHVLPFLLISVSIVAALGVCIINMHWSFRVPFASLWIPGSSTPAIFTSYFRLRC